jgi:hypothetical protein
VAGDEMQELTIETEDVRKQAEEVSELSPKFCDWTVSVGHVEAASSGISSRVSLLMAAIVWRAVITGFMLSPSFPLKRSDFPTAYLKMT